MTDKLTRRQMAVALAGAAPAATSAAVPAQSAPQQDPLAAAREQIGESIASMEEFDLPMSAEPAFVFKPY